jgi:hypothetical protein
MGIRKQPPTIPFSSSFSVGAKATLVSAVPLLTASFAEYALSPVGPAGPCVSVITGSVTPV